jgi:site-specific DNA recombinase
MRVRIIEPTKPPAPKRKRVCAYARVSSTSEAQGESLENQTTYYKAIIQSNPEYEYAGVFADYGLTGTKGDRPEFQKMLRMARGNQIDLILTKSISRFARNTMIVLELVRELKSLGVEIIFERENISTFDGDGELMLTVLSSFAQEESKSTSENLKWRYRRKFANGELVINVTRFLGYDKDEHGDLVINRSQAEIVKRIFSDYVSGKGSFVIAKELNADRVLTIAGGRWHSSTILNILKNEKYKGDAKLQKTYSKDHLSKRSVLTTVRWRAII